MYLQLFDEFFRNACKCGVIAKFVKTIPVNCQERAHLRIADDSNEIFALHTYFTLVDKYYSNFDF